MASKRADLHLVERNFFKSRAKAQEAIAAGLVRVDGKLLCKASDAIDPNAEIEARAPYPWVSRGGVKLAAALDAFGFDPQGRACLDIGASTGGFTHVLLSRGAVQVAAVDVGHGQLHPDVARDPRVASHEGTDARRLTPAQLGTAPALVTCDVSFISLRLVLPAVLPLAAEKASLIALVKPQFEAGPANVVKGLVKDAEVRRKICADIEALISDLGWRVLGVIPSPIEGGDGNREYLIGAMRP
ncbi:TlyA family RNA methyltransferase [Methylocapsa acidiphila]|uniref:TlyA family RNA methyltransferase n=1 Tax=Methylocapsa acidiphila TaxID=133552 RepID=UPI00047A9F87|nr:TlyA family RNA methyltransferase [Methylocapsa acidiphila]